MARPFATRVARRIKRLHLRGLVAKLPRSRRWRVTDVASQAHVRMKGLRPHPYKATIASMSSAGPGSASPTTEAVPGLRLLQSFIDAGEERRLLDAIDAAPWRADLRRRVQHYGWRYDYKARAVDETMRLGPLPDWATGLSRRLVGEGLVERTPDQLIVNEYQPGQGIAKHVDCVPCFGKTVLSLSLGGGCVMILAGPNGRRRELVLAPRSLLVLGGEARIRWSHAIPARKSDVIEGVRVPRARRISLTFRTVHLRAGQSEAIP